MRDTSAALLITLGLALPWSILSWVTGFLLGNTADSTEAARTVGSALQQLSPLLFFVALFRALCISKGVTESHLKLAAESVKRLRWEFSFLLVAFVVPAFPIILHLESGIAAPESILSRLLFLTLLTSLAVFLYRLLEPASGIGYELQRKRSRRPSRRGWSWLTVALAIPAGLAVMVFVGYTYSAGLLLEKLLDTLWLLFGLVLLREVIVRWLLIDRRRLLLRQALARRAANREAADPDTADSKATDEPAAGAEEAAIDMAALDADTRKLVNTTLVVAGLLALGSIWSPLLTAFSYFSDVELWQTHRTIDGEEIAIAVTVYDVFAAFLVAVVAIAAVRHVPSLVEMVLRQRPSLTAGSRLAFATLARYAIAVIGVATTISLLGVQWSKIQWLVAALGVGMGFGLQEIVANFISGLVILVERPIRVGNIVTVGDASGTVTQIQIRATTIRTFDRQELLVPNKEFITGRVLNWTLSDDMIRIYFNVGIAYGSNVELALKLLEKVAVEHPTTLDDPAPMVTFEGFRDNTMTLGLRCYVPKITDRPQTTTDLHRAINDEYKRVGLDIAVPQRDIHLDTLSPLEVRVLHGVGSIETRESDSKSSEGD